LWRSHVPPKCWYASVRPSLLPSIHPSIHPSIMLHSTTSQKAVIFIATAMRSQISHYYKLLTVMDYIIKPEL
jgi:hypothetical protein